MEFKIPPFSKAVHDALTGDDDKEIIKFYPQVIHDIAKFICPTEIELAGRPRDIDHEDFANKAVYEGYCKFLVENYHSLGSSVMIEDYKRKKWGDMKQSGKPANNSSPSNKKTTPAKKKQSPASKSRPVVQGRNTQGPTSVTPLTASATEIENDEANMDGLTEEEATQKYGYLQEGWVSLVLE